MTDFDALGSFGPERAAVQTPGDLLLNKFAPESADIETTPHEVGVSICTTGNRRRQVRAAVYVAIGLLVTALAGVLLRPSPAAVDSLSAGDAIELSLPGTVRGAWSEPRQRGQMLTSAVVERSTPPAASPTSAGTLTGWWTFTNRVESSSYSAFEQLNLGYRVQLHQRGNRVTGRGNKWIENGRPLPRAQRTPIVLEGIVSGDRVDLAFSEQGARRTSAGTFVMRVVGDRALQGSFASDAANSQGSSHAQRLESAPAGQ